MTAPANLYALMQRLGMAAITQATKTARLAEQRQRSGGDLFDISLEREAREEEERLLHASIAYTARLIVVCNLGTVEKARELEEKLGAGLKAIGAISAEFQRAIENLAVSAATYAATMAALVMDSSTSDSDPFKMGKSRPAREQTYKLSHAAIAFTTQLTVACSANPNAARDMASEMEALLVTRLDEAPWYEDDHE